MHKANQYISTLSAIAVAIVSLTACGSSSSDEVVARVGGNTITKADLNHWISIEAILTHEMIPAKRVQRGVIPDPPSYTACIAQLETTPAKIVGPKQTTAQLKSQCRQKYETLRQKVLNFLISAQWKIGEGAELGVKITDAEAKQRLEQIKQALYPQKGVFQKYLTTTQQTIPDWLFRAKLQLLEIKLPQKLIPKGLTGQQRQQAATKLLHESTKKWVARTSCRAGYVVPNCKQYTGPLPPEA